MCASRYWRSRHAAEHACFDDEVQQADLRARITSFRPVAPPRFCNRGEVRYGSIGGLEYEVPPVPVVLSVYQRGSLLDGLAMYLSCDTKKFHDNEVIGCEDRLRNDLYCVEWGVKLYSIHPSDNESTHILHNFWTSTHRGQASPFPPGGATGSDADTVCARFRAGRLSSVA